MCCKYVSEYSWACFALFWQNNTSFILYKLTENRLQKNILHVVNNNLTECMQHVTRISDSISNFWWRRVYKNDIRIWYVQISNIYRTQLILYSDNILMWSQFYSSSGHKGWLAVMLNVFILHSRMQYLLLSFY